MSFSILCADGCGEVLGEGEKPDATTRCHACAKKANDAYNVAFSADREAARKVPLQRALARKLHSSLWGTLSPGTRAGLEDVIDAAAEDDK